MREIFEYIDTMSPKGIFEYIDTMDSCVFYGAMLAVLIVALIAALLISREKDNG